MPQNTSSREVGLDVAALQDAVERFERGESMRSVADRLGIAWQRMLFILRDRGARHPDGRPVTHPGGGARTATGTTPATTARRSRRSGALTYGIEIECTMPTGTVRVGSYSGGEQVQGLPAGWKAKRDGSIHPDADGHEGVELVSPVLQGDDGVRQIIAVCDWLRSVGAKVNSSCGFHVHVGWRGNGPALGRLVNLVARNERSIYAAAGSKRREEGMYCRPISREATYQAVADGRRSLPGNRYHVLNLTNLRRGGKHTVEFRAFAGTTSATKILGYVQLCLGMVQKSQDASAEIATFDFVNGQQPATGCGALERLLSDLGWGNCQNYGLIAEPTAPTTVAIAFELGRLAQKYDGNAE